MKGDQMGTGHTNPSPRELPLSNQTRFSAEQAICSSSQHYGSCLFVAGPRQLWRVWPGVSYRRRAWTRIEDSWVVEQRVGWCAMSRGGEPWRGLLII